VIGGAVRTMEGKLYLTGSRAVAFVGIANRFTRRKCAAVSDWIPSAAARFATRFFYPAQQHVEHGRKEQAEEGDAEHAGEHSKSMA
jgi:hypothetical protein